MPEAIDTVEDLWKEVKRIKRLEEGCFRMKKRYAADPEKYRAKGRASYVAKGRAWSVANRERRRVAQMEWRHNNKAKCQTYSKTWQQKNREKISAANKAFHEANREKINARKKADSEANPEKFRARTEAYRKAHPEKLRAYSKAYRKAHPEIVSAHRAKRRARMSGARMGDQTVIMAWEADWRNRTRVGCHWCCKQFKPKKCHADHVIPLSKGGEHNLENLVVSCASCNLSKQAKLPNEWNKQLSEPVLSLF